MQERLSKPRDRERSGLARGLRSAIKPVGHAVASFLGASCFNTHRAEKKGWAIHNSTKLVDQSSHVQLNFLSRVMQSGVIGHQERQRASCKQMRFIPECLAANNRSAIIHASQSAPIGDGGQADEGKPFGQAVHVSCSPLSCVMQAGDRCDDGGHAIAGPTSSEGCQSVSSSDLWSNPAVSKQPASRRTGPTGHGRRPCRFWQADE
jgi:hypothetical protein